MVWHGLPPRMYGSGTASLWFVELRAWHHYNCISEKLASFFLSLPKFWVHPTSFPGGFENLKKLLIDLPRVWPLHQIKKLLEKLLEVATCLEKLHINFFAPALRRWEEWDTTPRNDSADDFQHTFQLRQIVMEGFDRTEEQIALIRLLLSSCRSLKTLLLIRHHTLRGVNKLRRRQGGIACPSWSMEDEKAEIVSQLGDEIHSDAEIFLR
ncbi:hypothetical protein PAHAL_7G131000 [Panicum hallii]|uniref:FBD domain-containing protein n=1 Tax=Panicum hallii TaxID=206008 RepID=A0A2S3I697_9POAL|nr:hypothetical protein PAHAL_7G131000 [Panicum hallii]